MVGIFFLAREARKGVANERCEGSFLRNGKVRGGGKTAEKKTCKTRVKAGKQEFGVRTAVRYGVQGA